MAPLFGIAPDKAFPAGSVTGTPGGLLHHHFTLAWHKNCGLSTAEKRSVPGGLFLWSVSASLRLPVRKYPALWCPDFPLPPIRRQRTSNLPVSYDCIFDRNCFSVKKNYFPGIADAGQTIGIRTIFVSETGSSLFPACLSSRHPPGGNPLADRGDTCRKVCTGNPKNNIPLWLTNLADEHFAGVALHPELR